MIIVIDDLDGSEGEETLTYTVDVQDHREQHRSTIPAHDPGQLSLPNLTRHFLPVLVVLRSQSCLRPEGRTRTLSGSCPDLSPART